MSDIDVKSYLDQLRCSLPYVPPISLRALKSLHRRRDYEGLVRLIRTAMNVEVRLIVGWVNSGGPKGKQDVPAWIERPREMPYYGTSAFKEMTIKMFLRRSFLAQSSYGQVTIAIAHELSHVVLDSIQHPLRRDEKAVDLTAMLLGFSHLYHSATLTVRESAVDNTVTFTRLGYLSDRELRTACRLLVPLRWRALQALRPFYRLLFVIVAFLIIVAAIRVHDIWYPK